MDAAEYTTWARFHDSLFPDFGQWWKGLKSDARDTLRSEWLTILERINLQDAMSASRQMLAGDVELCPSWERSMLASRIAKAAREIASERAPRHVEAERPVRVTRDDGQLSAGELYGQIMERIDAGEDPHAASDAVIPKVSPDGSGPRFRCAKCQDMGTVLVWHNLSIKAAMEQRLDDNRNRRVMAVACDCHAGDPLCLPDERTAPKNWSGWRQSARYSPDRYCRCSHGDVHNSERIAELVEWVGDYAKKRREAPADRRESVFDAWNQGALQLEPAS